MFRKRELPEFKRQLTLLIDGDLFKAILRFPIAKEEQETSPYTVRTKIQEGFAPDFEKNAGNPKIF